MPSPGNEAEPANGKRREQQSTWARRERKQTCSIMLTSDAAEDQQSTKNTVTVFVFFSSPEVKLEHKGVRETSCLCNSCYSTVTSNLRYVVFSPVTDCLLFAEAANVLRLSCDRISNSSKPANPRKPTTLKSYLK